MNPRSSTSHIVITVATLAWLTSCGNDTTSTRHDDADHIADAGHSATQIKARSVFAFAANFLLAHHRHNGGLVIRPGSAGFAKYLQFAMPELRWKLGRQRDGIRVAKPKRLASLSFGLRKSELAHVDQLSLRLYTRRKNRITVKLNGRSLSSEQKSIQKLRRGWQTLSFPVSRERLRVGQNLLALQFRGDAADIEWIQVGGSPPTAQQDTAPAPPNRAPSVSLKNDTIRLNQNHALEYFVAIPPQASLLATVTPTDCPVIGDLAGPDGQTRSLELRGTVSHDLSEFAGRIVRVRFRNPSCKQATLKAPHLAVPWQPTKELPAPKPPRNVILWVMDTLRGDRVRTVNPKARAEVPNLASLAGAGASFTQFYVQGNESQVSHASLWTSLYPINHRVRVVGERENYRLPKNLRKLPQLLKQAGRRLHGVTANGRIHAWTGYTQGFDSFVNLMRKTGRLRKELVLGETVYSQAIEAISADHAVPFFLLIGTIDTHKPWIAHAPWLERYDPKPYDGPFKKEIWAKDLGIRPGTMSCRLQPSARDLARILAIYDSDISYQDALLGMLIAKLKEWGVYEDTLLIVTSDHGEELWEYPKRCGHGTSSRQSLVHVPLVLHHPGTIPHAIVRTGVESVDILPTVLDALGLDPLEQAQGESLLPIISGQRGIYPQPSYSSFHEIGHTMRVGSWKLTVFRNGRASLHNVVTDPNERKDLADSHFVQRQFVADALSLFLVYRDNWRKSRWGVASNMRAEILRDLEGLQ